MTDTPRRVAEDAAGRRASFDEIEVGALLGSMEWTPDEDMIDLQCELDLDFHAWFSVDSPWGGRIAPPQISYRPPRWLFSRCYNVRGLFYKWELENLRPIKAGIPLVISSRIIDKYVKNDREFVVYQAEGVDADGQVVFRTRRTHVLDFIDRSAPKTAVGVDSGIKPEKL